MQNILSSHILGSSLVGTVAGPSGHVCYRHRTPLATLPACCGLRARPHHRLLLRLCLVDRLLVRLWYRLRGRFLGLRLRLRSVWLGVSRRRWPGRPPRRRGQRGSSVAVSGFVREPLPLVAGSRWHLRQPPRGDGTHGSSHLWAFRRV